LSSPSFNELALQFDVGARQRYDALGHEKFKELAGLSPTQRGELLKSTDIDEKSFQTIVESLNRRGENIELNLSVPKMSDSPVMYDVTRSLGTDTGSSSQSGAPTPVPNHVPTSVPNSIPTPVQTDAVKPVKVAQPAATATVVAPATPIAPDKPIYQADANKIPVTAVIDPKGIITVYEADGTKRPFNIATDTVMPGRMMFSPEARQVVEAEVSNSVTDRLVYADKVSELDKAVTYNLGEGSINGAYEDSKNASQIHEALSEKKEATARLKEANLPTSPKELKDKVDKIKADYASKNPIRGFFQKFSQALPIEDMLTDDSLTNVFAVLKWENNTTMSNKTGSEFIVTKSEIERHRLGVELINPYKMQRLQYAFTQIVSDPHKFYKTVLE
jgi:hypothetical protein